MNIEELMQKTSYQATTEQMVSIVEWYIKEKTGRPVEIDMYTDSIMPGNRINPLVFKLHLNKLFKGYVKALEHFKSIKNN